MAREIRHTFFIGAPLETVAAALLDEQHLQNWWTRQARVSDGHGRFDWRGHGWTVELEMTQHTTPPQVVWACHRSNMQNTHAWEGTMMQFVLVPEGDGTRVEFSHVGYQTSPCFEACEQGWGYFLGTSLKQYLETGKGVPYPEMQDTGNAPAAPA